MVQVNWKGKMVFESTPPSGNRFYMDAYGGSMGPTPVEALLSSIAACSGMDVVSILEKQRQTVTDYRIEIEADRTKEGEWPRPIIQLRIRHIVTGVGLSEKAVQRAVELSDEKYCTVLATLRENPKVDSAYEIVEKGD